MKKFLAFGSVYFFTGRGRPILIERYELVPDSARAARAGGLGGLFVMRYEGAGSAVLNAAGDGAVAAPAGVAGGGDGKSNHFRLAQGESERTLGTKEHVVVIDPGDRVITESAGGGYGNPRERAPAKVAEDLAKGYVSPEAARNIYGYDPGASRTG